MRTDEIREFYDRVDAGDVTGMCDLFAPDAVYHRPGYEPLDGRAAIERFYREKRVIRDGRHRIDAVVTTGDTVAVHGEFRGTLLDGRKAEHRFAEFFTLTGDGLLSRRDTFFFAPLV
jgi:steroid Delta-isomerase